MIRERALLSRQLAVAAFVALIAMLATRVFQRTGIAWCGAIPLGPALVATFVRSRRLRWIGYGALAVASGAVASWTVGGDLRDVADGIVNGWSKMLSTSWPSPLRAELVAFVAVVVAVAAALSAECAVSTRWRAALLLPGAIVGAIFVALSASQGPVRWGWFAAAVAMALVVLVVSAPSGPRLNVLAGEPAAFATAAVLLAVAIGAVSTIGALNRFEPREAPESDVEQSIELNPLSQVVAQRETVPEVEVMRVTKRADPYLRMLALEKYDGVQWILSPTFSSVGRRLGPPNDDEPIQIEIETLDVPMSWIPMVGQAERIDRDVAADPETSMLYIDPPLTRGDKLRMTVTTPRLTPGRVPGISSVRGERDKIANSLSVDAVGLAGQSGSIYDRLRVLEENMRATFVLDPDGPAGVNAALMGLFVNERKGTEEQFVSAFALLSRALGARSRIAVGYLTADGDELVTTADARAWPEVWFENVGWVPFDPTPEQTLAPQTGAVSEVGPGPAPVAPLAPPPQTADTGGLVRMTEPPAQGIGGRLIGALAISGGLLATCAAVVGVLTGAVLMMKRRRRRRRLTAVRRSDRVVGAWAEATDTLVDYGATFQADQTNHDVAVAASTISGLDDRRLFDLAELADEAVHAREQPDELTVAHAMRLLGQIEQSVAEGHPHLARWRARVALRSLSGSGRALVD